MGTKVIHVEVNKGRIEIAKGDETVGLRRAERDKVRWVVRGPERIEIEFEGQTPFAEKMLRHDRAGQDNEPVAGCAKGSYKYTIYEEGNRTVKLDPHIIIDPPPSGPYTPP